MARLTRKNMKVFAANASNNGVFGSLEAGNPTVTNDVEQIQGLTAWGDGWNAATLSAEKLPPLEEFQGVQYVTTYQQAYIMQEGLPEWASSVTYFHGSLVKKVTANGFQIYNSLTDNNEGNQLSDTTNWKLVMDSDNLYALDNSVVHIAGAETITGAKTFNDVQVLNGATLKCFNFERGTNPQTTQYVNLYTTDSTATIGDNTALGLFRTRVEANGNVTTLMRAFKNNTAGTNNTADIQVIYPASGNPYATAPTPTDTTTTSGTQIATTGWVNTVGNNVVHRTGDESITGRKNFVGGYNNVRLSCTTNDTTGNNNYTDIAFYNNSGSTKNAYIRANNLGNLYLSATDAVTAPASDKADSILTTVAKTKGQNGYFKLGNGLIIQWGYSNKYGSSQTVTLPTAFTTTNYAVTISRKAHEWREGVMMQTDNYTKTTFDFTANEPGIHWIAIGY